MNSEGIKIIHAIPGRIRFRVSRIRQDKSFGAQISQKLSAISTIQRVETNPVTGSVLVLYDPVGITGSLYPFLESFTSLFPGVNQEELKTCLTSSGCYTSSGRYTSSDCYTSSGCCTSGSTTGSGSGSGSGSGTDVPAARKLKDISATLNEKLKKTGGLDLKILLPVTLFALGLRGLLVSGDFAVPAWYDFLWFSFGTFFMLNPLKTASD